MFEKFDPAVKDIVVGSQTIAQEQGSPHIDASHLVRALLRHPAGVARRVLAENGLEPESVETELDTMQRRGGVSDAEVEALAAVGIDVEHVIDRLARDHGASPGGRRRRRRLFADHKPFTDEAKRVLLRSLQEARELGDRRIGVGHLLLAAVGVQGPVADVLVDAGITRNAVRRHLRTA